MFVAIFSGALLWIGFWDVIDSYLVPKQWWAKLCMTLVGALGALATRSLYDQQLIHPHDSEMGTSVVDTGDEVPGSLAGELTPRRSSLVGGMPGGGNGALSGNSWSDGRRRCCLCLHPPPFSASKCARALLATFSGLTMWVGLWDLIEEHALPNMFTTCSHEPSFGCACVKLGLVAIGAFGLYMTRSLYGDHSSGPVHFQRL